jgi:outer membrane receptor protein involved in Fe transport
MPVAISVVGKQLIEDTKPVALPEVMNKVAGVVMPNLMNEQHSMSIRAPLNTRPIYLYMEDGIPIRSTGVFNHNALIEVNLPAVRAIEIVKGPGSALYGSNAVSGAINFLTQRASAIPMLELGLQTDNYTYRRANLSAGNTFGNLGLYVGGYYARQTDTWREHSAMEKFSLNVRGDYRVDDKTTLEALFTTNNLDTDVNGGVDSIDYFNRSYPAFLTFAFRKVRATRARLTLEHNADENTSLRATVYYRNNEIPQIPNHRFADVRNQPTQATAEMNSLAFWSLGADVQFRTNLDFMGDFMRSVNAKFLAGMTIDRSPNTFWARWLDVTRDPATRKYTSFRNPDSLLTNYAVMLFSAGGFAQVEMTPTENLKLITGLRYDRVSYDFTNFLPVSAFSGSPSGNTAFNNFAPRIGLIYGLSGSSGLYANYSLGFLPPEIGDLYRGVKTPELQQSTFSNYEVGAWLSLFEGLAYVDVSGYLLDGKNEIISVRLPDNSSINQNVGVTRHYGVEWTLGLTPCSDLSARFAGSYARHILVNHQEGGVVLNGNDMAAAPNWTTYSELLYKPSFLPGARIGLELQTMSGYFLNSANNARYNGHAVFHLRTGYRIGGFDIFVNVFNLTNALFAESASRGASSFNFTPGAPRMVNLGVSYNFFAQQVQSVR